MKRIEGGSSRAQELVQQALERSRPIDAQAPTRETQAPPKLRDSPLAKAEREAHVAAVESALIQRTGGPAEDVAGEIRSYLGKIGADFQRALDPPKLEWDPGWLRASRELTTAGLLGAYGSLHAALDAVAAKRKQTRDHVFLITRADQGFAVFEYSEKRLGRADLGELTTTGLPLGGDLENPQTWVVDGQGKIGRLTKTQKGYALAPQNRATISEPPAIGSPLPLVVPQRQVNHGKNVAWTPSVTFRPSADIDDLARVMKFIHDELPPGIKVKAGGSRHSWSNVAATEGIYIHPENMKFVEPVAGRENYVRIGSGTRVREINAQLWAMGKSLPVLGGFDGQTLGGVLPTGTHGSVLAHGPLASMVRSLDLVRADGGKMRIEPRHGMTDPAEFAKTHPDMELVQDDEVFRASLIHMGSLGVVHSYVLEAVDRFYLNEVRTETTLEDLRAKLSDGNIYAMMETAAPARKSPRFEGHPERAYHLELLFNPHSEKVIVTSRHPTAAPNEPDNLGERPDRDLFRVLRLGSKLTRPAFPNWLSANFHAAIGWTVEKATRMFPGITPALVDSAMGSLPDQTYTQRSYNVFNIGDGGNALPALSSTVFVPLRADLYLRALEVIRETAKKFAAEHGGYETGPISLRFVKGSEAHLASNEDVASFEIIFAGGTPHAEEMMRAYYEALRAALGKDARFHWGQMSPGLTAGHIEESYSGAAAWRKVRDRLDPERRFLSREQEALFYVQS